MLFFQLSILRQHILGHIVIGMLDMPLELFAVSGNGILNNNIKIQIHVRFEATRAELEIVRDDLITSESASVQVYYDQTWANYHRFAKDSYKIICGKSVEVCPSLVVSELDKHGVGHSLANPKTADVFKCPSNSECLSLEYRISTRFAKWLKFEAKIIEGQFREKPNDLKL